MRKELENLLGSSLDISRATLNRALVGLPKPLVSARPLTAQKQWVIAASWHEIAGREGINPPALDRLLKCFCELCRRLGQHERSPDKRGAPLQIPIGLARRGSARGLEEILFQSEALCRARPKPDQCLTGPARFGLLCAGLSAHPFVVAVFLTQHVNTRGVWVRECVQCGGRFVSPGPAHRHCGCAPDQKGPHQLSITRVAETELSLRA